MSNRRTRPGTRLQYINTSPISITHWNMSIRDGLRERSIRYAVRALLYPVYGGSPRIVYLPLSPSYDFEPGTPIWTEDIDVRRWFPSGWKETVLSNIAGIDHSLRNNFSVFTARDVRHALPNECMRTLGSPDVKGNVVVIRRGRRQTLQVTHMHPSERSLVDILVTRWFASETEDENTEDGIDPSPAETESGDGA
ncbi:uncharacterized protein TRAVEDRAFT_54578 [Trametes versicolor FP-101664 SS1]|uniref:Uncharacterized protein n=1 Tax=Trametes versicolor (strain FP-101664) TaxID=717944 RepID=R7S743_TRAVS|nr:uncharacterized protein TRAVEDRAFT_54578 [Trametes versicolor FP-101664 SS1]EIW51420.1 hypothetical protein TRAVEDRAFT_54578 [Trametes versicolor FP-101664 SS1]